MLFPIQAWVLVISSPRSWVPAYSKCSENEGVKELYLRKAELRQCLLVPGQESRICSYPLGTGTYRQDPSRASESPGQDENL